MFYIPPSGLISDTTFILAVDQLKKYLNLRLSQSARHILYLPITFFSRCKFSSYRRLGKQKYVLTHVDLKKPAMFYIYTSCLISDTIFILLANQLKKIAPRSLQKDPSFFISTHPLCFISDTIFILLADQFKKLISNSHLYQSIRHSSYLHTRYVLFLIRFGFFSRLVKKNII